MRLSNHQKDVSYDIWSKLVSRPSYDIWPVLVSKPMTVVYEETGKGSIFFALQLMVPAISTPGRVFFETKAYLAFEDILDIRILIFSQENSKTKSYIANRAWHLCLSRLSKLPIFFFFVTYISHYMAQIERVCGAMQASVQIWLVMSRVTLAN